MEKLKYRKERKGMTAKKFGLAELERYEAEVGFKKSDVRTIKGVCAIVDLPVTVAPEAQEVIVDYTKGIARSEERILKTQEEDVANEQATKDSIARLKAERNANKKKYAQEIAISKNEMSTSNGEIKRLQNLLKNFS